MKKGKWHLGRAIPASVLLVSMFASPFNSVVAKAAPTISTQSFTVDPISTGNSIYMNTTQITHAKPTGLDTTKPVKWTTSDPYVAYVDMIGNANGDYSGKILGVSGGTTIITGTGVDSSNNPKTVSITVTVVESQQNTNLEKVVYYYNAGDPKIPAALATTNWQTTNIPTAPTGKKFPSKSYVGYVNGDNGVKWLISKDALIKSNDKILLGDERPHGVITGIVSDAITLYDPNLSSADQIQYLQGGRYIPQTGDASGSGTNNGGTVQSFNAKEVITNIMPDGNNGLWILGEKGNATHIVRKQMSLMGKALVQTEISRNFTDRFGFQSGSTSFSTTADMNKALMTADKDAARATGDTDNDGLWTTMYASGEIWRYNYMKENFGANDARTQDAKASAIRAVESIITLGYVSGTQLKVTSKNNVNDYVYVVNSYGGNVSTIDEAKAWLAVNEGKPVYVDENGKYTLDHTKKPAASGFFARSYKVDTSNNGATDPEVKTWDNAWIKKKAGQATDVNGKTVYYNVPGAFKNGTNPALKAYDTVAVPPRLTEIFANQNAGLDADTKALDSDKVVYKATTSTDELVGHYFTLDLAYKAFKEEDPELAALIKNDMINHTNALVLNNYFQLTVNGENPAESRFNSGTILGNGLNVPNAPTRWANMNPEYLDGNEDAWGRDADYEDGPLNAQLQLQALVVARDLGAYTPEEKALLVAQGVDVIEPLDFANEYKVMNGVKASTTVNEHNDFEVRYPKTHNSKSMLDMSLQYLARYFGIAAHNGDDIGVSGVTHESYMNYSDEEEEALAYYTLSHHADKFNGDEILEGMNQWWTNEKREKNPFMTTFYAASLGALKAKGIDIGNAQVDIAGSEWNMTRIPNNFVNWDVLSANRNDVTHVAPNLMADQLIPRDEVMMSKYNTNIFGTMDRRTIDSGNSRSMESSTVISMPYWITQNPEDASYVDELQSKVTSPVNNGTESLEYPTNLASMNPNAKYNENSHTFTINVGDSVKLDAKTTGYVRNVSWSTSAWDQAGYNNGLPSQINADANVAQVLDLRNIATYGDEGNVSPTDLSVNGEYYGAYATGLKPGTSTVTAYVIDGFFRTPAKITYTIKVVDSKKSAEAIAPVKLDSDSFAYPTWLKNAMTESGLNTDGNKFVDVSYESSSPSDVTVSASGDVTYNTNQPADITATVVYSGMTMNGDPSFAIDSHVMTFERTVSKNATHTVSFDTQGGSTVDSKTVGYNEAITAPTTAPTRTGYTFLGWYKDEAGTQAWNFVTDKVTASTTLYAKWSQNNNTNNPINKYTVTFNSNNGSVEISSSADEHTKISEPTAPTKVGYTFAGWYNDAVSKTEAYNFNTEITGNITLTAHWTINSYKVTFNSKGGSTVTTKIANYNSVISKPTNPTRKGFVFGGWYKDAALKTTWNFTTDKLTANTTLFAKWTVSKPTGLKATKASKNSIKLTWAAVSGVSGYEINRATTSNFTGKVSQTSTKGTLTATGLVKGKTYYFRVRAYTVVGNVKVYSGYTTVVKIKL